MSELRVIVGISGASGAVYAVRALEALRDAPGIRVELVVTPAGRATLVAETDRALEDVLALADVVHRHGDITATISSGSYRTAGMLVIPCSMRTLSAVATSRSDTLLTRAADVTLKEGRPLVLAVRESPLHLGHLRLMTQAAEIGARVVPLMPGFYHRPSSLEELVDHMVMRVLDQLDVNVDWPGARWSGLGEPAADPRAAKGSP